jgi:hypothetical protein
LDPNEKKQPIGQQIITGISSDVLSDLFIIHHVRLQIRRMVRSRPARCRRKHGVAGISTKRMGRNRYRYQGFVLRYLWVRSIGAEKWMGMLHSFSLFSFQTLFLLLLWSVWLTRGGIITGTNQLPLLRRPRNRRHSCPRRLTSSRRHQSRRSSRRGSSM